MPKHDHRSGSPWNEVLSFSLPNRHVQPFRVHKTNRSTTDGGITRGGLVSQIDALKQKGGTATISCYTAFVSCAIHEGFSFTTHDLRVVTITNPGKLTKAIDDHRSMVNSNPTLRENLSRLFESVKHL